MKKSDLILELAKDLNLSQKKATDVVDFIFEKMRNAIENSDRIEIRGFGTFYVKNYNPRKGRNPKTGEIVSVPPKRLPFFKMGKEMKKLLIKE